MIEWFYIKSKLTCVEECEENHTHNAHHNECISHCKLGQILQNGICVNYCDYGFFRNELARICDPCDKPCLTCSETSTNCNSCEEPFYLLFGSPNTCVEECPEGFSGGNK